MGHTLIICTVTLLASQSNVGQVIDNPADGIGRPCNCQGNNNNYNNNYNNAPKSGIFGLGLMDKMRGTPTQSYAPAEQQPTLWDRFQNRMDFVFGRVDRAGGLNQSPQYAQTSPSPYAQMKVVNTEPPLAKPAQPSEVTQVNFQPTPATLAAPAGSSAPAPMPQAPAAHVNFDQAPTNPEPPSPVKATASVILPKFADKIGHEDDYTWVTGQLGLINGQWVIHYATPDTVESHGGKLTLIYRGDMSGAQVGDLVSVSGGLIQQGGRVTDAYQVSHFSLIERK